MNKLYNDTAVQAIANAIRAKNGSSDTYTIAEMSTALNDISYYAKPTISNVALATFEADGLPLNSLKVSVEAKQDLHGYDHPWVGGAGKNKFDYSTCENLTIDNSGTTLYSPDRLLSDFIPITPNTNYTLSFMSGIVVIGFVEYSDVSTFERRLIFDDDTGTLTITPQQPFIRLYFRKQNSSENISPTDVNGAQLEKGSTATSFEPYSNICPISGWDAAKVDATGKNLLKVTATTTTSQGVTFTVNDNGSITCLGTAIGVAQLAIAYNMPITSKVGTVTLSGLANTNNLVWNYVRGFDENSVELFADTTGGNSNKTFDLSQYPTLSKMIIVIKRYQNGEVSGTIYPQLEVGETATTYEPYNGVTTTISLGQTVYGGEVDVINGILKITDGYIASYNGDTLPSTWISSMDVYAEGTTPTTGAEVVYTLASSTTVSLTPTLIKSLNGQNNLSVDCGEVIELEYIKEV